MWVVELTTAQLALGRKKYQKLLRCYAEQQAAGNPPAAYLPTKPAPPAGSLPEPIT